MDNLIPTAVCKLFSSRSTWSALHWRISLSGTVTSVTGVTFTNGELARDGAWLVIVNSPAVKAPQTIYGAGKTRSFREAMMNALAVYIERVRDAALSEEVGVLSNDSTDHRAALWTYVADFVELSAAMNAAWVPSEPA